MRPHPSAVVVVTLLVSAFLYLSTLKGPVAPAKPPCKPQTTTYQLPLVSSMPHGPTNKVLPGLQVEPDLTVLKSRVCSYTHAAQDWVAQYAIDVGDGPWTLHRKQWEFAVIMEALEKTDKLGEGKRGLGFAVGQEPLARYFVKRGSRVTVSDMPMTGKLRASWAKTGQHAGELENTWKPGVVTLDEYKEKADFVPVDMNNIPKELLQGQYDFIWSCGSLEHVGVGQASLKFILKSLEALKVGGVAAHTTEFVLSSKRTFESEGMNFFTEEEIRDWVTVIESLGHKVIPLEFAAGTIWDIDEKSDSVGFHRPTNSLQILDLGVIHTSISLIIIKGDSAGKPIPTQLPPRRR
eukprot:TRINITY_DN346_c0_g2_i2.p1 TRINITY_DN346_c0_g2~~TRINITY_DN346_c0_g2_i2.p1  ORF type:complete len:371 (+),score=79.67 TRINITY_DN346_c0_g2_i2:64-1113(+)